MLLIYQPSLNNVSPTISVTKYKKISQLKLIRSSLITCHSALVVTCETRLPTNVNTEKKENTFVFDATLNFRKFNVAINPTYRIFYALPKVAFSHAY